MDKGDKDKNNEIPPTDRLLFVGTFCAVFAVFIFGDIFLNAIPYVREVRFAICIVVIFAFYKGLDKALTLNQSLFSKRIIWGFICSPIPLCLFMSITMRGLNVTAFIFAMLGALTFSFCTAVPVYTAIARRREVKLYHCLLSGFLIGVFFDLVFFAVFNRGGLLLGIHKNASDLTPILNDLLRFGLSGLVTGAVFWLIALMPLPSQWKK